MSHNKMLHGCEGVSGLWWESWIEFHAIWGHCDSVQTFHGEFIDPFGRKVTAKENKIQCLPKLYPCAEMGTASKNRRESMGRMIISFLGVGNIKCKVVES
jgi:hypothetical protein